MLPIVLKSRAGRIGLTGHGEALERRRAWLEAAGVHPIESLDIGALKGLQLLFVAGLDFPRASELAAAAQSLGVLVHVEDIPSLCDFHAPAIVRRGDLTISVSTGGRAPALAKLLREWLDLRFGSEWARYAEQAGFARDAWRAEGANAAELSRRTRELAANGEWLR